MESDIDLGLLPIDPEALSTAIRVLRAVRLTIPVPRSTDTVEGFLVCVGITFNDFVASILFGDPGEGVRVGYHADAAVHACTIAALLALVSDQSSSDRQHFAPNGDENPRRMLFGRWLEAISEVALAEEEPVCRPSTTSYVGSTALMLSVSTRALIGKPRVAIEPEDVPGRPRPMGADRTPEDAVVMLVRCAAAALCMAALLAPDFRLQAQ